MRGALPFDAEIARRVASGTKGQWPATSAGDLVRSDWQLTDDDASRHRERAIELAEVEKQKLTELETTL